MPRTARDPPRQLASISFQRTRLTLSRALPTQVIGAVVDVEFANGNVPDIYSALKVTNPAISDEAGNLVLEVALACRVHVECAGDRGNLHMNRLPWLCMIYAAKIRRS